RMPPLTFRRNAERRPGYDTLGQWQARRSARDPNHAGDDRASNPETAALWMCSLSMTTFDWGLTEPLELLVGTSWQSAISRSSWLLGSSGPCVMLRSVLRMLRGIKLRHSLKGRPHNY